MNYITAEQFLAQPKEIQESLEQWEEKYIQDTDLFGYVGISLRYKKIFPLQAKDIAFDCIGSELIPLFSESQLRGFIEGNVGGKIDCTYWDTGYEISIFETLVGDVVLKCIFTKETNLLQAYWEAACKIVEDRL